MKYAFENVIFEFDNEAKSGRPDKSRLKSVLTRVGPLSTQLGLILFKYALDKGLLSWADSFSH
jgi:hypothetical protein